MKELVSGQTNPNDNCCTSLILGFLFLFKYNMIKTFEQSKSIGDEKSIFVFRNGNNDLYIGDQVSTGLTFNPDEAILLAKEIILVAKKIKRECSL